MDARWWPALVVGAVVLTLSLVPLGGGAGSVGGGAVAGVGVDKLLHVADYAVLALALLYATRARSARVCLAVFAAAVALGGAVELLQGVVPTRHPSLLDAAANAVGAALATVGWWVVRVRAGGSVG